MPVLSWSTWQPLSLFSFILIVSPLDSSRMRRRALAGCASGLRTRPRHAAPELTSHTVGQFPADMPRTFQPHRLTDLNPRKQTRNLGLAELNESIRSVC